MKIKNYITYIRKYRLKSVFIKNLLTFSLILIIPFGVISLVVYNSSQNAMKNEELNISNEKIYHLAMSSDNFIKSMNRTATSLTLENSVLMLMQAKTEKSISSTDTYSAILSHLSSLTLSHSHISDIEVYAKNTKTVVSSLSYKILDDSEEREYLDIYNTLDMDMVMFCNKKADPYSDIIFCKKVYNNIEPVGMIIIKVNIEKFYENLGISTTNNNNIFILCKDGTIVLSSDISMIGSSIDEFYDGNFKTSYGNITYLTTRYEGSTGYIYYYLGNETIYALATAKLVQLSAIMIVFIVIMSIIISMYISAKFYRPLSVILDQLQGYAKSYNSQTNEVSYITKNILDIGNENIALNKEIQDNLIELNNTQLNVLLNQINPHFLLNTLETIKWFVVDLEDTDDKASTMIELLSKILRYSLDNNEYIVDMDKELEYTETYIEILSIRYSGMFSVEWDVEPKAHELKIMKLSLQPIIENAISHGIIPMRKPGGKISVRIYTSPTSLITEISDNGTGFPKSKLKEVIDNMHDIDRKSRHGVGLSNVNGRIKLIYGEKYGIEIESEENVGTMVRLKMKLQQK